MRLWHESLIPLLPRQQLLGQHRECCALRGKGWGRKHSVVDYVFTHSPVDLVAYHYLVMDEMERRGYKPDKIWRDINYRGKELGVEAGWCDESAFLTERMYNYGPVYAEHNESYLKECLRNLQEKGIKFCENCAKCPFIMYFYGKYGKHMYCPKAQVIEVERSSKYLEEIPVWCPCRLEEK